MIGLYRSILEEHISIAIKSVDTCVGAIKSEDDDIVEVIEEEKYQPRWRTPFCVQETVNLADPHVSFNETVTVASFPSEAEETANELSLTGKPRCHY